MSKKNFVLCGFISLLSVLLFACAANTTVSDPIDSSPSSRSSIPTPLPILTFDEEKALASQIPYNDLFRNNEAHIGKQVWYQGKVIQVLEENNNEFQLRANVTRGEYGWDDTVFLHYSGTRILEGDIIEFIGTVEELLTYEAIFGQEITIPSIRVTTSKLVVESGSSIPISEPTGASNNFSNVGNSYRYTPDTHFTSGYSTSNSYSYSRVYFCSYNNSRFRTNSDTDTYAHSAPRAYAHFYA